MNVEQCIFLELNRVLSYSVFYNLWTVLNKVTGTERLEKLVCNLVYEIHNQARYMECQ